jgi:hypothetical protein
VTTPAPNPDSGREAIVILGGLPPGEPMMAEDGALRWTRREGEPLDAFKARVMAEPIEATTGIVVFGGLPAAAQQTT